MEESNKRVNEAWGRLKGDSNAMKLVETARINEHRSIPVVKIHYKHDDNWNCVVDDITNPPECIEKILSENDLELVHVDSLTRTETPVYGPKEHTATLREFLSRE